jgi:hypothetical protein
MDPGRAPYTPLHRPPLRAFKLYLRVSKMPNALFLFTSIPKSSDNGHGRARPSLGEVAGVHSVRRVFYFILLLAVRGALYHRHRRSICKLLICDLQSVFYCLHYTTNCMLQAHQAIQRNSEGDLTDSHLQVSGTFAS